jgi:hypothetical protein
MTQYGFFFDQSRCAAAAIVMKNVLMGRLFSKVIAKML